MECKVYLVRRSVELHQDLIETLWNVKDLIVLDDIENDERFNRDIVECKVITCFIISI